MPSGDPGERHIEPVCVHCAIGPDIVRKAVVDGCCLGHSDDAVFIKIAACTGSSIVQSA